MIRLLNAGFERLRKNKIFWLLTIFSVGFALLIICTQYKNMIKYDKVIEIEQLLINYPTIIGIVIAIFTSLFLGVEYSDGAIRNKISIGHRRINIYLSNLIIVSITSLLSYILFMIVVSTIGIPLFGGLTMQMSSFLKIVGCIFVIILSYSSIFTFIAMIISNKTITAIVSIMLVFGMMMTALLCFNILSAKEYVMAESLIDGEIKYEEVPNPKYPGESKKKLCQKIIDIVPAGQAFQLAGRITQNLKALPIYSLGIFIVFTGAGIVLFEKKELK